jgi:hypothetical protein
LVLRGRVVGRLLLIPLPDEPGQRGHGWWGVILKVSPHGGCAALV